MDLLSPNKTQEESKLFTIQNLNIKKNIEKRQRYYLNKSNEIKAEYEEKEKEYKKKIDQLTKDILTLEKRKSRLIEDGKNNNR